MRTKPSIVHATSLFALVIGCSSESGTPSEDGGSSNQGTGGATQSSGGATTTGNGGSTTTGNGGSTANGGSNTGSGGSTTMSSGGSMTASGGSSTGSGGSTTTSNGGSTTTSNGGSASATGGASTGTGGAAAAGASSLPCPTGPCPTGCAQLSVPFTAYKAAQQFEIYFADAVDLSAATINVKLRKVAGKAGGVQVVVKDGSPDYQWAQGEWIGISDLTSDFATKSFIVASPASSDQNHVFDPTKVKVVTIQVNAGDPWFKDEAKTMEDPSALINPTVVQVDEISISGATGAPGPWTFATATETTDVIKPNLDAAGQSATPPWAVAGSTVTWVGP